MSILSDKEITNLSHKPSHKFYSTLKQTCYLVDMSEKEIKINGLPVYMENQTVPDSVREYLVKLTEEELYKFKPMISPFTGRQVKEISVPINNSLPNDDVFGFKYNRIKNIISYGLSSYGYDLRLDTKFKIFTNVNAGIIDPKNFDEKSFIDHEGDYVIIPPNSFILGSSVEKLNIPRNVTGIVLGKSTYARTGVNCLATPLEAGWSGYVTLEFSNSTPLPVKMYANEGCCQVLFFRGNACNVSYADRSGKYQNQGPGPILAKV